MPLNKLAKNHLLGYKILESNLEATLYGLSDLDSITCDIEEEDIKRLLDSNALISNPNNSFNYVNFDSTRSVALPVSSYQLFSKLVFDKIADTPYLFEISSKAKVSDILQLINPDVRKLTDVKDYYFIGCDVSTLINCIKEYTSQITDFHQNFINKHKSNRKVVNYPDADFYAINFVEFPSVFQDPKTKQYYVHDEKQSNLYIFNDGSSNQLLQLYDFIINKNESYINLGTRALNGVTRQSDLDDFVATITTNLEIKATKTITKSQKRKCISNNFTCKSNNSAKLLYNLLNKFNYNIISCNHYVVDPLICNSFIVTDSIRALAVNKNSKHSYETFLGTKYNIDPISETLSKYASKIVSLINNLNNKEQKIGDKYSVERELIPRIAYGTTAKPLNAVYNYLNKYPDRKHGFIAKITDNLAKNNIKITNIYLDWHTDANKILINEVPATLAQPDFAANLKYEILHEALASCFYRNVFSNVEITDKICKKMTDIADIIGVNYTIGESTARRLSYGKIPEIAKYIQHYYFKNEIGKSTKAKEVNDIIASSSSRVKIGTDDMYLGIEDLNRFKSNLPKITQIIDDNEPNYKLFNACFKTTLLDTNGVFDVLGLTSEEIENPNHIIMDIILSTFNITSILLEQLIYGKFTDSNEDRIGESTKNIEKLFAETKIQQKFETLSALSNNILSSNDGKNYSNREEYEEALKYDIAGMTFKLHSNPSHAIFRVYNPTQKPEVNSLHVFKYLSDQLMAQTRYPGIKNTNVLNTRSSRDLPNGILVNTLGNDLQVRLLEAIEIRLK